MDERSYDHQDLARPSNQITYRDERYLDHVWGGLWWAATGR